MAQDQSDRIAMTPKGVVADLTVQRYEESGGFVARCPALAISAQGESAAEAELALEEAINVFIADLGDSEMLAAVLTEELGWKRLPATPEQGLSFVPPQVRTQTVRIGPISPRV